MVSAAQIRHLLPVASLVILLILSAAPGYTATTNATAGGFVVQVGAFRNRANAEQLLESTKEPAAHIVERQTGRGAFYLVIIGQYLTRHAAQSAAAEWVAQHPAADYWIRESSGLYGFRNERLRPVAPETSGTQTPGKVQHDTDIDGQPEDTIIIAEDEDEVLYIEDAFEDTDGSELIIVDESSPPTGDEAVVSNGSSLAFSIDELRTEYAYFPDNDSAADGQEYLHGQATGSWLPAPGWELQLSGRVDGYYQQGDLHSNDLDLDYGESYVRYSKEQLRLTVGAQKIIWGRIDEFPPTDRLSTQDISRFVLDDLAHRRRASPAIRLEYYRGNAKFDVMALPLFRKAELPDKDSVWFPINRQTGEIIGLKSTQASRAIVKNTPVNLDDPDSTGGVGFRFSNTTSQLDYAITLQRGKQTIPHFSYNAARQFIEPRYPRSSIIGGGIGTEALGGTLRFEAAWSSDTPVTRVDGRYTTVESVSWGAALEIFPGDEDARLNLQITGINLLDAPSVLDRKEVYAFNGTYDLPFANEIWRFRMRFYTGLNDWDLYLNPEIAYKPWPSQEAYLATHYFDGDNGTPGGFHQNNSVITLGWRGYF